MYQNLFCCCIFYTIKEHCIRWFIGISCSYWYFRMAFIRYDFRTNKLRLSWN